MDFAPHGATRKSNPNQTAFSQAGHEWWPRFPAPLARNSRFCGRFITPYACIQGGAKKASYKSSEDGEEEQVGFTLAQVIEDS